jgi:hypothetical protein
VVLILAVTGLRRRPGDSDRPYEDGHTFDPELGVVYPTDETETGEAGQAVAGEAGEVAEPEPPDAATMFDPPEGTARPGDEPPGEEPGGDGAGVSSSGDAEGDPGRAP